ncbi:MAG: alpha/beta fold hydrolase [Pseudomonadales bacterium]|nr:alpha/beta fold hydrolase [Pseudomonadales bacterium]
MKLDEIAQRRNWRIANAGQTGGQIEIGGWDFGGSGELAVLQHANGMCAALWALVATQLTDRYHVIAIDARGHGDSEHLTVPDDYGWDVFVQDIISVTELILVETQHERIALGLGSSFGGILLAGAEAKSPGLMDRLVMLDPPIHPTEELAAQMGIEWQTTPSMRAGLVEQTLKRKYIWESRQAAHAGWREKPLFAPWDDRAFAVYLDEGMRDRDDGQVELKCHPTVEAHIFATTGSLGLFDYAPMVNIPVDLVHAKDGHFPLKFYEQIATVFPNCNLSQLDAGHMLPLEAPTAVVEFIRSLA